MAGFEHSDTVFNVVFFTVLTSVLIQGTFLMPVARWLKVDEPLASRPRYSLEIERRGQAQGETREIEILPNMAAVSVTRCIPFVVADQNREVVEELRAHGIPAVFGDASTAMVLAQAHVARAAILVIATPDTLKARQMIETAKMLNPAIEVVVRAQSEMEASLLPQEQVDKVLLAEHELADGITRHILGRMRSNTPLS